MGKYRGLGRRSFLTAGAALASLAALLRPSGARAGLLAGGMADAQEPTDPSRPRSGAALLGLRAGDRVGRWTIGEVFHPRLGAVAVVLETARRARFQVDVLRRDPGRAARGVANAGELALFLANRGDGERPTDEEQGLGAMALADLLAARAREGARAPSLLTFDERRSAHPLGAYGVPLR